MSIKQNIDRLKEKICDASVKSNRNTESVKLMAVSKFHSVEEILEAYDAGLRLFGENRVQEAVEKFTDIELMDLNLHLIGSLQRNKVKKILPLVECIQSVDRIDLLNEIAKFDEYKHVKLLLEVHTGEESKNGFTSVSDVEDAIRFGIQHSLNIVGFMTMAPFTDDKKIIRNSFAKLRQVSDTMQELFPSLHMPELSMGMSNDYEIAIEEGSTLIRVGTAIFGQRV